MTGTRTSIVEVGQVSQTGFWLLTGKQERFLSFDEFPWFRDAAIAELFDVVLAAPGHVRWPALDIDLSLESIDRPGDFPLVSKGPGRRPAAPQKDGR